jgi:VIT1/CCC1 family predicted Fe2+/Mn2+ transporter
MFSAFIAFGGMPLLVYTPLVPIGIESRRVVSTVLCFVSFLLLGSARARLTGGATLSTSCNMAALGTAAALVSYLSSRVIYAAIIGAEPPVTG